MSDSSAYKAEYEQYLSSHPELRRSLHELMMAVLSKKPSEPVEFARKFFANPLLGKEGDASPRPIVICGPSGVGKGTIITKLQEEFPDKFGFSVSHTTRGPRPGEEDGIHYNFTTKEKIEEEIAQGKFIEHAHVHGNVYGSSFEAVERVSNAGKVCILDIDVQGMMSVKRSKKLNPVYVFVKPPSPEDLEQRLRGRGTETEDKVLMRLANAKEELKYADVPGLFDHVIVNDDLTAAVAAVKKICEEELFQHSQK
eukprot:TRINITY_DN895_c0_g1_i1.p1 TRINITY_DN895_c0_g1~~TRINITY_DN895_c0_g1_i1.p1  ORF type:complete len:254 (+),score=86.27 TRINITY_DN895_c0_g1_i1:164-925(+)